MSYACQNARIFLCISIFLSFPCLSGISSAVTYTFSGGRFGDNLLSYCHAKWISYKYNIPLLYKPFDYSDQLMLHQLEFPYSEELEEQFGTVVTYSIDSTIDGESGSLYGIPFFPESNFNRNDDVFPFLFSVDWEDPGFKALLKTMICPINPLHMPKLLNGVLSVAVHVRKGTGWDIPNYRITPAQLTASHPLRFAPDSFYIEQLKKIAQIFPDGIIYVYLFTDHDDPASLALKYTRAVNCGRMIINYRTEKNNEFINVLDDFFALTRFDCLIRPDSNFSFIASKLGDYKVQISPWHGTIKGNDTVIDEINLIYGDRSFILKEWCGN